MSTSSSSPSACSPTPNDSVARPTPRGKQSRADLDIERVNDDCIEGRTPQLGPVAVLVPEPRRPRHQPRKRNLVTIEPKRSYPE